MRALLLLLGLAACRGDRATIARPSDPVSTVRVDAAPAPPVALHILVAPVSDLPFRTASLKPGQTIGAACAELLGPTPAKSSRCGGDGGPAHVTSPVTAVREWTIEDALLDETAFVHAEVWYDEEVSPLHGHVVTTLTDVATARLRAFATAHPKQPVVVVVDGLVQGWGRPRPDDKRLWMTLPVPPGEISNDAASQALAKRIVSRPH